MLNAFDINKTMSFKVSDNKTVKKVHQNIGEELAV